MEPGTVLVDVVDQKDGPGRSVSELAEKRLGRHKSVDDDPAGAKLGGTLDQFGVERRAHSAASLAFNHADMGQEYVETVEEGQDDSDHVRAVLGHKAAMVRQPDVERDAFSRIPSGAELGPGENLGRDLDVVERHGANGDRLFHERTHATDSTSGLDAQSTSREIPNNAGSAAVPVVRR